MPTEAEPLPTEPQADNKTLIERLKAWVNG
jgi:hypothetical protein